MARIPENINFCLFAECHYLESGECTVEKCVFNAKWIRWWEFHLMPGPSIYSVPPEGMKAVKNIYYDPELNKYTFEREE